MSKEHVSNFGNILVYNPNSSSQKSSNIEDLSIFVDLQVEMKNRLYSLVYSSENKETISISYSPNKSENISFFRGSVIRDENVLTDFYTDTTVNSVKENTIEGIGINNIDVTFDAWYKPSVNITFVDVRGSGVFMSAQYVQDGGTLSEQFFSSFFSFPYPVYTLKLKGYYGEPVEYKLYCTDAKAEFDSTVGNFVFNVTFKGVTYAFLDDLDISYLRYAPYCKYEGETYWKSKNFKFDSGEKIPTIDELHTKLQNISISVDKITSENELAKIIDEQSSDLTKIKNLLNKLNSIKNLGIDLNIGDNKNNISCISETINNSYLFYGIKSLNDVEFDSYLKNYIKEVYDDAKNVETLKQYISSNFKYECEYKDIAIYKNNNQIKESEDYSSFLKELGLSGYTISFKESLVNNNFLQNYNISLGNINLKDGKIKDIKYIRCADFSQLSKALTNAIEQISEKRNKNIEKINDTIRNTFIDKIGFKPSINNFMRIISSHLETFMHVMYKTIDDAGTNRSISKSFGLRYDNTDNKENDDIFYPFPALYMDVNNVKTETWPSEKYIKPIIPEAKLVYELTNAQIRTFQDQLKSDVFNNLEKDFIPIDLFDFIYNRNENPYNTLFFNNDGMEDIIVNVLIRMFRIISLNPNYINTKEKDIIKYIEQIGNIEGYNLSSVFNNGKIKEIFKNKSLTSSSLLKIAEEKLNIINNNNGFCELNLISNDYNVNHLNLKQKFIPTTVKTFKNFKKNFNSEEINFTDNNYVKTISFDENSYAKTKGRLTNNSSEEGRVLEFVSDNDFNDYLNYIKSKTESYGRTDEIIKRFTVNENFYLDVLDDGSNKNKGFVSYYKAKEDSEKITNYSGCLLTEQDNNKTVNFGNKYNKDGLDDYYKEDVLSVKEMVGKENISFPLFRVDIVSNTERHSGSLFGSSIYYMQKDEYMKGYLFLNTLPLNINNFKKIISEIENNKFLKLQKSVILYIGSLYYRYENDSSFYRDGYFLGKNSKSKFLKLKNNSVLTFYRYNNDYYEEIPKEFFEIRKDVKNFFVNYFKEWVDSEYKEYKKYAELNNGEHKLQILSGLLTNTNTKVTDIKNSLSSLNISQYNRISFKNSYNDVNENYLLYLENNPDGEFTSFTLSLLKNTTNICNYGVYLKEYTISEALTKDDKASLYYFSGCKLRSNDVIVYIDKFLESFKKNTEFNDSIVIKKENNYLNEVNSDIVYASKYHYLKNLYDKWLCSTREEDYVDFYKNFNIIDRAYNKKAGDECLIDFNKIIKFIYEMDQPLKVGSLIGKVMSENNFLYIPVSNLVFYNGINDIQNLFEPMPYNYTKPMDNKPSYLCIYVGKPSSVLDYGYGNKFKNDTYNIYDIENKNKSDDLPSDFQKNDYRDNQNNIIDNNYFMMTPAFLVSVGNQNENYFKKINVNMNEPSSTEQSISAVYNLSNQSSGKKEGTGMDLYNIYSKRSFKCEIEMMGNAQIQPFMYFQLTNIPMWNGTYLIYKIKHNISAGKFTTYITGMKVQKAYPYFDNQGFASGVNFYKNESVGLLDNYNLTRIKDEHIVVINNGNKAGGLELKNPYNIRTGEEWVGKKGTARIGNGLFVEFIEMKYGIRAAAKLLKNYNENLNIKNINDIINRWAPKNENKTEEYIKFVEQKTGIDRFKVLNFNKEEYYPIMRAMAKMETGYSITDKELDSGWDIINITSTNYG